MSVAEKLIIKLLVRLFWLITQAPGVARYSSDVRMFGEAEKLVEDNADRIKAIEQTIKGYEK
jgi:hypothetical protein